jgi:hypothetical protein
MNRRSLLMKMLAICGMAPTVALAAPDASRVVRRPARGRFIRSTFYHDHELAEIGAAHLEADFASDEFYGCEYFEVQKLNNSYEAVKKTRAEFQRKVNPLRARHYQRAYE